ncbi:MAG: ribonuclease HII [Thalassobaculum sp.]|uniref:ribonuclease HII n=1 Tax=Thalassobaculum sp. TaxID=2022740 RepID=UPI0032EF2B4B
MALPPTHPTDALERAAGAGDGALVVGVDEVGRGPWAGPVVAAAAILDLAALPPGAAALIADSKTLTAARRLTARDAFAGHARVALGRAEVVEIDRLNILQASMLAMCRAVEALLPALPRPPDLILVDGNRLPDWPHAARAVVRGDASCLSIAAAAIAAKLARDAEMAELARRYPGYGWESNAGYGTPAHRDGLRRLGVTEHHRRSFAPIRALIDSDAR